MRIQVEQPFHPPPSGLLIHGLFDAEAKRGFIQNLFIPHPVSAPSLGRARKDATPKQVHPAQVCWSQQPLGHLISRSSLLPCNEAFVPAHFY